MSIKDSYSRVAHRSVEAAEAGMAADLPESAGFNSYHALESIGGALCHSVGADYDELGHRSKINQFVAVSNRGGLRHVIGNDVAYVTSLVASLRNQFLYPHPLADGSYQLPEDVLDTSDARDLIKSVKGVVRKVQRQL